jgi:hypothetical protein
MSAAVAGSLSSPHALHHALVAPSPPHAAPGAKTTDIVASADGGMGGKRRAMQGCEAEEKEWGRRCVAGRADDSSTSMSRKDAERPARLNSLSNEARL